jgi:hypothetical protein
MIDELILNYLILFVLLEIYEVSWQKAQTVMGMLARMYQHYSKNIFLFLIMHPTFYFAIGFFMITNYNVYAMVLLLIKAVDIIVKILLIQQIFVKKEVSQELALALLSPINNFFPYIGLLIYPPLIVLAIL